MQPQRRSYSKSFKVQVLQEWAPPGASIASVAQHHSLNANLVHKWIRVQTNETMDLRPAFIPLPLPLAGGHSHAPLSSICVEIQHSCGTVKVNWPTESADAYASFLRDLLQ
ncbi:transposase [Pseudomonas sp. ADAK18]|uniref:transposase n=1 Tax=Pseudomonas sp. ADAK18 TaxID=2730848 RepID=UPI0014647054|nr:transposase [Pseudomonas sp. ADAK18]